MVSSPTVTGTLFDHLMTSMLRACLHTSPRSLKGTKLAQAHCCLQQVQPLSTTAKLTRHADAGPHARAHSKKYLKRIKRAPVYLHHPSPRYCSTIARSMSGATIKPQDEYRLPADVKPTHYDLTIRTDLEEFSFEGFVKIQCVA